jgi:hypothetical protein
VNVSATLTAAGLFGLVVSTDSYVAGFVAGAVASTLGAVLLGVGRRFTAV